MSRPGGVELRAAVVRSAALEFAVVQVRAEVLSSAARADGVAQTLCAVLPGLPIVLVSAAEVGEGRYHGREDVVRIARGLRPEEFEWETFVLD